MSLGHVSFLGYDKAASRRQMEFGFNYRALALIVSGRPFLEDATETVGLMLPIRAGAAMIHALWGCYELCPKRKVVFAAWPLKGFSDWSLCVQINQNYLHRLLFDHLHLLLVLLLVVL